jgi:hypothetical protein
MTNSGYAHVTVITNADTEVPSSDYDRVTVVAGVTHSDIERMTSSGFSFLNVRVCDNSNTSVATACHSSVSEFVTTVTRP